MENEVTIKVTIWNEGRHEKLHPDVAAIYPSGIHGAIAAGWAPIAILPGESCRRVIWNESG